MDDLQDGSTREPFNGHLLGVFLLCVLVGCIPGHGRFVKATLVAHIALISYYLITKTTTGDHVANYTIGSAILTQALTALDCLYFTDPNALTNYHRPNTGRIAEQSFAERVQWAFYLYTNNRGIGWAHEPRDLPEGRYTPSTPRWRFVLHQLVFLALSVLVECIAYVCAASNPGMSTPGQSISESPLVWRVIGVVGYGAAGAARINAMYCIASAFVVRIGYSRPDRWLPLFGSPLEGWTIRRFWRKVWHQLLRKNIIAASDFVMSDILGIPPARQVNNKVLRMVNEIARLHTTFYFSVLIHIGGEYMLLGKMGYGAASFFLLQPVGITLEILAAAVRNQVAHPRGRLQGHAHSTSNREMINGNGLKSTPKSSPTPSIWIRFIGYVWVVLWFAYSLPPMVDPLINFGMFVDPGHDLRRNSWIPF